MSATAAADSLFEVTVTNITKNAVFTPIMLASTKKGGYDHISVAAMIILTNDVFFAVNGIEGPKAAKVAKVTRAARATIVSPLPSLHAPMTPVPK